MKRIPPALLCVAALVAVLLAGPRLTIAQEASPAATSAVLPTTSVGEQLAWVLGMLNEGALSLTPADVTARFAPVFLGQVPPEQAVALTQQLAAAYGPFAFQGFTRPPLETQANALVVGAGGTPFVVPIAVEAAPPHLIAGLNVQPVPPPPGVRLAPVAGVGATPVASPGRLDGRFDVGGGRRLYLSCVGTGSPTVVLESGLGDPAAPWFAVEIAVAGFTRVCSYDRANTLAGASDPAPTPRTGADAVADMHALLAAAGVPGPYVLAGHSIGGLFVRLFAHTYPDEVVGLALIDASHEDQSTRLEALVGPELREQLQERVAQVPDPEGMDFTATAAEVRAARAASPLPPMPLAVVTAGQPADPALFPPGWPAAAEAALWRELQADLAGLVPNGRHVVATRSGHYVHQTEPELVVAAIQQVVDAVRAPNTWATPVAATPAP